MLGPWTSRMSGIAPSHFVFRIIFRKRGGMIPPFPFIPPFPLAPLTGDPPMAIKVGDRLPDGKLMESTEFDSGTQCAMPPKEVNAAEAAKGKKIAVFGLPGAYTPT